MWKQPSPDAQPPAPREPREPHTTGRHAMYGRGTGQEKSGKRVYKVCPDICNDIYHLYDKDNIFVDVAYVPDYVTSVMLNKLFRCIKENDNLDALEESDDEEEFEDMREDKFVSLDKSFMMECTLHPRFRKWVPVRVVAQTC